MIGLTNAGGGGGSGGLNLQFIGSMTAPSNPKENMIWVKTDTAITQFLISKSIGAWSVIAGAVEMTYKASDDYTMAGISTLFFNGKLHGVYGQAWFYPTALYQSNGITAEPKDAYIYKSGTWVQFSWSLVSLYNNGVWNTSLTGEWIAQGMLIGPSSNPALTPHVEKNAGNFRVYYNTNENGSGIYRTGNKIDLTNFKTLRFEGEMGGSDNVGLNIWNNLGNQVVQNRVANLGRAGVVSGVGTLDVSKLTGNHYIGFNVYANRGVAYSYVVCKKLYLS